MCDCQDVINRKTGKSINHPRPERRGIHLRVIIDHNAASGGEFNPQRFKCIDSWPVQDDTGVSG
jgi:hypothetical protein